MPSDSLAMMLAANELDENDVMLIGGTIAQRMVSSLATSSLSSAFGTIFGIGTNDWTPTVKRVESLAAAAQAMNLDYRNDVSSCV